MSDIAEREGAEQAAEPITIEAFSFGDDASVVDGQNLWSYFDGMWRNGDWYEPPVPFIGLAKSYRMAPHHQSAIKFKVNLLKRHFVPSRWMDAATHERAALDYLQMGNLFLEEVRNMAKRPLRYRVSPALHTRVGVEEGRYFWVKPSPFGLGSLSGDHEFRAGSIVHLAEPDVEQEVYGLPEWLSALQSGLLNEAATLFRRRYYKNGAHAGFVFYLSEETVSNQDADAIRDQLTQAKGVGNFKNLFIHAPRGNKDGVQIIPIAEVAARDEFLGIKNVSRDDLLSAHRMPPQLLGIVPTNNGGFGDVRSAMDVFFINEIGPLMETMRRINDITGLPVVNYRDYAPMMPVGGA
ncbi:phage portal protein [Altericroceibacterium endophyticum]|uniref:Phage portal protein n=1 Tax=Altericroceibacterium endophyticum TaxID=1808508 RepID=A0A6I4T439_9SPHN|nr:phage portal protein [Altericroceibacterium endophyticum]MXO64833.1 phage portal protein [Altericroceibacterium endophyticum]